MTVVTAAEPVLEIVDVARSFEKVRALDGISLSVRRGEIHALLGPNGAGKTTLLRTVCGLVDPEEGAVLVHGVGTSGAPVAVRRMLGFVPSGDRTFYLRLSGLENLLFFGRLHGMHKRAAVARAGELLDQVGLAHVGRQMVGTYSHGMQKRLSVARALLTDPPLLLVDEATHDLDPEGAGRVTALVRAAAARGTAVLWTTQRLDEIRGFADAVTVIARGKARFHGTVPQLLSEALTRRYLVELRKARDRGAPERLAARMSRPLGSLGTLVPANSHGDQHWVLHLREDAVLGDAIARLDAAGIDVLACREERSDVEAAFLRLTAEPVP
jgi:ABC-2 type transport system ATP-binding protein